jgi:hypothetical protein
MGVAWDNSPFRQAHCGDVAEIRSMSCVINGDANNFAKHTTFPIGGAS